MNCQRELSIDDWTGTNKAKHEWCQRDTKGVLKSLAGCNDHGHRQLRLHPMKPEAAGLPFSAAE